MAPANQLVYSAVESPLSDGVLRASFHSDPRAAVRCAGSYDCCKQVSTARSVTCCHIRLGALLGLRTLSKACCVRRLPVYGDLNLWHHQYSLLEPCLHQARCSNPVLANQPGLAGALSTLSSACKLAGLNWRQLLRMLTMSTTNFVSQVSTGQM